MDRLNHRHSPDPIYYPSSPTLFQRFISFFPISAAGPKDNYTEMKMTLAAGGIVVRNLREGFRLALVQDKGKLSFTKGHIESGETIKQAALARCARRQA